MRAMQRRGVLLGLGALTAALLVLGACGNGAEGPPAEENGVAPEEEEQGDAGSGAAAVRGDWVLRSGSFAGEAIPVATAQRVTLQVGADGIGGVASCNGYGGTASFSGSAFSVGEIAITAMGCPGDTAVAERLYMAALGDASAFALDGAGLVLRGAESALRFERLGTAPLDLVLDREWQLVDGAEGSLSAGAGAARFLLRGDGTFAGGTGCRELIGEWLVVADEVLMTSLRAEGTHVSCTGGLQEQDGDVVSVIGDGFRLEVEGEQLRVISRDGEWLVYERAAP